jgi:hypothetical protein
MTNEKSGMFLTGKDLLWFFCKVLAGVGVLLYFCFWRSL